MTLLERIIVYWLVKRVHLTITGRVQGVGFRWFCQGSARGLGITGYVKNIRDGSVEIEAQGDEEAVDLFIGSVSKGPRNAEVNAVEREERSIVLEEGTFSLA